MAVSGKYGVRVYRLHSSFHLPSIDETALFGRFPTPDFVFCHFASANSLNILIFSSITAESSGGKVFLAFATL